jgi:hypothetical protein
MLVWYVRYDGRWSGGCAWWTNPNQTLSNRLIKHKKGTTRHKFSSSSFNLSTLLRCCNQTYHFFLTTADMTTLDDCPAAPLLWINGILDTVCCAINFPMWQSSLSSVLKNSFLSHPMHTPLSQTFPTLTSYSDVLSDDNGVNIFSSVYKYAFESPTTALGVLTTKDSMITLCILVLTLRQMKAVACPAFCRLGRRLGRSTHGVEWERKNEEKIMKFGEYVFRLLFHSVISVVGLWCFWGQPWWDDTKTYWVGYPSHAIETSMIWYYLIQGAYNIDAMSSLIELSFIFKLQNPFSSKTKTIQSPISVTWNPDCRGDFREMAIHHGLTNVLVIGSSHFRLTRHGSMVFMIHDISDVPVDLSKLANFMKWKITTIICFVSMVITWAITRLGILPFVLYRSTLFETHMMTQGANPVDVEFFIMWRPFFFAVYGGIILLHVYWFNLFIKIGYALVVKKELHDYSEHKQGEDQSDLKKKN